MSIVDFFRKNKSLDDEAYNVVKSVELAKGLYKELLIKTHPDKHPNKLDLATNFTALINKHKYNYRELLLLKQRIERDL